MSKRDDTWQKTATKLRGLKRLNHFFGADAAALTPARDGSGKARARRARILERNTR
jgi:hypothetical protein